MKKFTDKINESVEDTIPTAEDVLVRIMSSLKMDYSIDELNEIDPDLVPYLVEEIDKRTRLYVEAALKAASEKATILENGRDIGNNYIWDAYNTSNKDIEYEVNKNSILNAYPLDNIK